MSAAEVGSAERPPLRWTADCWTAGCGWSRVGFDVLVLAVDAEIHRKERHDHDDE